MAFVKDKTPYKGDLLRVKRKQGYFHFGIAVSEDRVIHFTAPNSDLSEDNKQLKIVETPLSQFIRGDVLEIQEPYNAVFTRDEVVKRAKNYANSSCFRGKPYNFISNNCEHFARYCYDGKATSKQVNDVATAVVTAGATIVTGTVAAVVATHNKKVAKKKD